MPVHVYPREGPYRANGGVDLLLGQSEQTAAGENVVAGCLRTAVVYVISVL